MGVKEIANGERERERQRVGQMGDRIMVSKTLPVMLLHNDFGFSLAPLCSPPPPFVFDTYTERNVEF